MNYLKELSGWNLEKIAKLVEKAENYRRSTYWSRLLSGKGAKTRVLI